MCGRYTILWVDVVVYTTLFVIDGLELAMILVLIIWTLLVRAHLLRARFSEVCLITGFIFIFTMMTQLKKGHGQPPIKGPQVHSDHGADQVNLVLTHAPTTHIKPCIVRLQDCLSKHAHIPKKLQCRNCGAPGCATCKIFDSSKSFTSPLTHRLYDTFIKDMFHPITCKSKNLIYLITCVGCSQQYVGQTTQPLHLRMNGHRKTVRKKECIIGRHFSQEGHAQKVQVIEGLITKQGETKKELKQRLMDRELWWQKELGTIWPYGLNDNVKGIGNVSKKYSKLGSTFSLINSQTRSQRSHGHRKHHNKLFHEHVTIDYLHDLYHKNNGLHLVRSILFSLPHNHLHDLNQDILDCYLRKMVKQQFYLTVSGIAYNCL